MGDATDTHGERRARRDGHGRRRPTAQAPRAARRSPVRNPRPPCAPLATIVTLTTPAGTVKVCGTARKVERLEPVGALTVKVCAPLVPPAVVTVTEWAPVAAAASSTKLAVSDVVLPTTTLLTVTPPPLTATVVAPTTKLVPVSVTATVSPRLPRFGETLVSVGAAAGGGADCAAAGAGATIE